MKSQVAGLAIVAGLLQFGEARAEEFRTVSDSDTFINVVKDRELTRFGIKLAVLPTGEIRGSAFGQQVTGAWRWDDGFFCRDLYFGNQDLGPNCQVVQVNGEVVRFIADQGQGEYADLRLR